MSKIGKAGVNGDLIIASNRLPVRISITDGELEFEHSSGGLVSALGGVSDRLSWIGWPGGVVPPEQEDEVTERLAAMGLVPVFLDRKEEAEFYGRICNDTIWPLFHYFVDRLRFTEEAWQRYVEVNERFADAIAAQAPPHGRVWVHDFHLMLVPEALRRRRPDLSIGFFLHVPFPSSEIYRLLPVREEVLRGLLGADYVSFHTSDYVHHFRSSCLRVLGLESTPDTIDYAGRSVEIGADPIGIDVAQFRATLSDPETARIYADLDERYKGQQLVLGVERLDYTKGIPHKLRAFERFLEQDPTRAQTTTMLQVLVPSRLESAVYRVQRDEIELEIARINGRFGAPGRTPVEYFHRSISPNELVALYRRADVMLVTPVRDGMNLVAQEFVLCQSAAGALPGRARGVLLLSEFAGAAHVLPGAVLVNPWHVGEVVSRLVDALALSSKDRRSRLRLMSGSVDRLDSRRWAARFLDRLTQATRENRRLVSLRPLDAPATKYICQHAVRAERRTIILDYDGTLRELADHPRLAEPTAEILDLLESIAALPATYVHVVSGRTASDLESWFGHLPLALCAEHGYLTRAVGEEWKTLEDVDVSWTPQIERLFKRVSLEVPGTHVERKLGGVAWHYRRAEAEYAEWRARELMVSVERLLHGIPAESLTGHRVIEVRARGVSKGAYVRSLFTEGKERNHFVLSAGDGHTDVGITAALPPGSITLHVGTAFAQASGASVRDQFVVASPGAVREFLHDLVRSVDRAPRRRLTDLNAQLSSRARAAADRF